MNILQNLSEPFLKNIKDKYDYMLRILNSLNMGGYEILEFLLVNNEFDDILKYESHVKGLDDIVFLHYFFGGSIPKESFQKVIQDPQTLGEFHKEFDNKSLSHTMEQMDYLYEDLYNYILSFKSNYPIEKLPVVFQKISHIMPLTHSLEAARMLVNSDLSKVYSLLSMEIVVGITYAILGYLVLKITENLARKKATLDVF